MTTCSDRVVSLPRHRRLSPRLAALLRCLEPGLRVADIACDHAHFAIAAAVDAGAVAVLASDIAGGPVAAARANVAAVEDALAFAATLAVDVVQADGFSALADFAADVAVVAGIGGELIGDLLRRDDAVLGPLRRLLLSPQGDAVPLRDALAATGWRVQREWLVAERGRIYVQIDARRGGAAAQTPSAPALTAHERFVGRLDRDADAALFGRWCAAELRRLHAEIAALTTAGDEPERLAETMARSSAVQNAAPQRS